MGGRIGNFNHLNATGLPVGALDGLANTGTFNYLNETKLPTPYLLKPPPTLAQLGITREKSVSESLALEEALRKQPGKVLAELLVLLDQATPVFPYRAIVVSDNLVLVDALVWQVGKVLAEDLALTDFAVLAPFGYISLFETLSVADQLVKNPGKVLAELLSQTETLNAQLITAGTTFTRVLGEINFPFDDDPLQIIVQFNRHLGEIFQLPDSSLQNDYIFVTPTIRDNLFLSDAVIVVPEYLTPPSPDPGPKPPPPNFLGSGIPFDNELEMRKITEGRTHVPGSDEEHVYERLVHSWPANT